MVAAELAVNLCCLPEIFYNSSFGSRDVGKKSRKKRERRLAREEADYGARLRKMIELSGQAAEERGKEDSFQKSLEATRELLLKYECLNREHLQEALA